MTETSNQLKVLLKKNFLLKRKNKCGICCEIVFPIVIVILLFALLQLIMSQKNNFDLNSIGSVSDELMGIRTIVYGPAPLMNAEQNQVITELKSKIATAYHIQMNETARFVIPMQNQTEMDTFFSENSLFVYAGIWFDQYQNASSTVPFTYSIRMDSDNLPANDDTFDTYEYGQAYYKYGFLQLQLTLDQILIDMFGPNTTATPTPILDTWTGKFPDPFDTTWQKWNLARDAIYKDGGSVFVTVALFMYGFRIITDLVIEKETKIKEGMKMMGMGDGAYYISWTITALTVSVPVTTLIFAIIRGSQIIYHTNAGAVWILYIVYLLSLINFGFVASIFFDSSRFAGLITYGVVVGINVAGIFVAKASMSKYVKYLISLLSPVAFTCAHYHMAMEDLVDLYSPLPDEYSTPVGDIIGMLILDNVLYVILYWYLNNVIKSEYGTSKPLLFFLNLNYWFPGRLRKSRDSENTPIANDDVELIPSDIRGNVTVSIRNLVKEFDTRTGKRVAVDGLNLDIYQDQIHAFLGHNGAGKSTTIGCLTGLIPPTDGDATIQGYNIISDMNCVRRVIGVCPQQDILYPTLSVVEHLRIYAALKGIQGARNIDNEAVKMANEVGLGEKMHAQSKTLSGGQKRKLCLGIAFIGRSKVIFLDEPTSGMDPLSRRGVWDFLLKYKQGRSIILTTHFMNEADFLGDRIAIISHGKLRCDGSSLFLKKKFGVGYLLTLAKIAGACETGGVTRFVQSFIPEATILSDAGTELSYRLPTSSQSEFVPFFRDLDQQKQYLGIGHYGISITTMEEVFLRIGQEASEKGRQFNLNQNQDTLGGNQDKLKNALQTSSEGTNWKQQLKALIIKRIIIAQVDLKNFFLSIIIPAIVIAASIVVYKTVSKPSFFNSDTTILTMDMGLYGSDGVLIQNPNNDASPLNTVSPYRGQLTPISDSINFEDYMVTTYKGYVGALDFETPMVNTSYIKFTNYYNRGYIHAPPVTLNMVDDAILRNITGGSIAGIKTKSMPFKHVLTIFEQAFSSTNLTAVVYFAILFMSGYSLMAASFAGNLCMERVTNIKRLLYISGCKKYVYWLSNLLWDYVIALILIFIVSGVLAGVEEKFKTHFGIIFLAQCLYSTAAIPLSYLFSHRFKTSGGAVGAIFGIMFIVGFISWTVVTDVRMFALNDAKKSLSDAGSILALIFYIFSPVFCLGNIILITLQFPTTLPYGQFENNDLWDIKNGVGAPMLFLFAHTIVWTVWIFLLDYAPEIRGKLKNPKYIKSPAPPADEDSDVAAERIRVHNLSNNNEVLVIRDLHKLFPAVSKQPAKIAVHNTTLGIPRGQVFALLGMNGAGKSTTLSMLSGDILPTSGSATINGYDVVENRQLALKSCGSCPQFDALLPLLNCREQLWLYSRIKGIPEDQIHDTVEAFISMMDLSAISSSNVGGYSGGNKRKVSLSIAMLGNPSVVYLDEPSTGCDPQVRRFMWNVISEMSRNKVIIITTHSLEECEALCQRVSIMKDGQLKCLGSNQHIKSKFGSGYSIDIKFKKEYLTTGIDIVTKALPNVSLLDHHDLVASFEMANPQLQVGQIFEIIQQQLTYLLDDYSVSQTSLEQVFLKLTSATYQDRINTLSQSQLNITEI